MKKVSKRLANATLAVTLLTGACSADNPEVSRGTIEELRYDAAPEGLQSQSNGDCNRSSDSWAVYIDPDPHDKDEIGREHAIGLAEDWRPDGKPIYAAGVVIRGLGKGLYKVKTSEGNGARFLDLNAAPYSEVLDATDDYSAVFSALIDKSDGKAYFRINCLSDFGFHGDSEPVPLSEVPQVEPDIVPLEEPASSVIDA